MKVEITALDQSLSLGTGETSNYVVFLLPSGRYVRALVDDDTAAAVISEYGQAVVNGEEAAPRPREATRTLQSIPPPVEPWPSPPAELTPPAEEQVNWTTLPDTQLPPGMRQVFEASGIEPVLSRTDFDNLKLKILEKLRGSGKPTMGEVVWDQGPQRQVKSAPRRTVPMDEAGNPIPPGGLVEADPGESQDDDDGVAQL
jgi:hypothetical protein